jgi:hypothetical protein
VVFGDVKNFAKKYDITGVTNGELLVLYFMSYPDEYFEKLIVRVFEPNGFELNNDYLLVQEELALGVIGRSSESLNHPISCLEGINWIGSVLKKDGNWVWKNDLK